MWSAYEGYHLSQPAKSGIKNHISIKITYIPYLGLVAFWKGIILNSQITICFLVWYAFTLQSNEGFWPAGLCRVFSQGWFSLFYHTLPPPPNPFVMPLVTSAYVSLGTSPVCLGLNSDEISMVILSVGTGGRTCIPSCTDCTLSSQGQYNVYKSRNIDFYFTTLRGAETYCIASALPDLGHEW